MKINQKKFDHIMKINQKKFDHILDCTFAGILGLVIGLVLLVCHASPWLTVMATPVYTAWIAYRMGLDNGVQETTLR